MANRYTYKSPGVYYDTVTKKEVRSTTDPNKSSQGSTKKPASSTAKTKPILAANTQINNASQATEAEKKVQDAQAQENLKLGNANQINPFGSQTTTIGPDGRPIVTTSLSQSQQSIANADDAISQMGREAAQSNFKGSQLGQAFNPTLTARTSTGNLEADRARIEDAVYKKLTKNVDYNEARDKQNLEQDLANRGIPYSNDPNSQYQQQMKDFNDKYAGIRESAAAQSVAQGGEEYSRNVGIGETMRANDYMLQSGQRGQQLSEAQQLGQMGPGLRNPTYTGFQGTQVNYGSPTAADAAFKQLANQRAQIAKSGGGGGGGGSSSTTASAFG